MNVMSRVFCSSSLKHCTVFRLLLSSRLIQIWLSYGLEGKIIAIVKLHFGRLNLATDVASMQENEKIQMTSTLAKLLS